MKSPIAFNHGQFGLANRVKIDLLDAGFVWGATATDRLRTFQGRLFRVGDHLRRFRESCRLAHIPLILSDDEITQVSERLVASNRRKKWELSLVWVATPGVSSGFSTAPDGRLPNLIAYTQNLTPLRTKQLNRDGARLQTFPSILGVDPRIKHRSRLPWWIAWNEVRENDRHTEPLLVDSTTDCLLETPAANFLAVFGETVVAPAPGTVLEGVSQHVVEELCGEIGLHFERRPIRRAEIDALSEALLTNTSFCVTGVSRIDGIAIPFPGPVLGRLRTAWSDLVGMDIHQST